MRIDSNITGYFALAVAGVAAAAASGCRRAPDTSSDAAVCDATADPPSGDLTWQPGTRPMVAPRQTTGWVAVSNDPKCRALAPGAVPPMLSWTQPAGSLCEPAKVDARGNLAVLATKTAGTVTTYFYPPDGATSTAIVDGAHRQVGLAAGAGGFVLSSTGGPRTRNCQFATQLRGDGSRGKSFWTETAGGLTSNPAGGFLEQRQVFDQETPAHQFLQFRWLGNRLDALGNWTTVSSWTLNPGPTGFSEVVVDRFGRALLLSYSHPKTFGLAPPPSQWRFSARWIERNGALSEAFQPASPTWIKDGKTVSFTTWGKLLPLAEGGCAAYLGQKSLNGAVPTLSGWYASYASGASSVGRAPAWLQPEDGSIQLLQGGAGYAATRRDPITCQRTAVVFAPSGQACFTLSLQGSGDCASAETIWPDGTLVLQDQCRIRWWPGLAGPAAPQSVVSYHRE